MNASTKILPWCYGLLIGSCHAESVQMLFGGLIPGYLEQDASTKKFYGADVDKLGELARLSGVRFVYQLYPMKRVMQLVQQHSDSCTAIVRLPNLESQFQWSEPLVEAQLVLMARGDRKVGPLTLEQAKSGKVGVLRGTMSASRIRLLGFRTEEQSDAASGLRMLQLGRIDYWATVFVPTWGGGVSITAEHLNIPNPQVALVLDRTWYHLACNLDLDAAIMLRLNQAIVKMKKTGDF